MEVSQKNRRTECWNGEENKQSIGKAITTEPRKRTTAGEQVGSRESNAGGVEPDYTTNKDDAGVIFFLVVCLKKYSTIEM